MDFSNAGVSEEVDGAFRAHVQRSDKGSTGRHIYGPRRPDQQAAQEDLESMRAAASGMSRYRRRRVANRHVLAEGYMDRTLVSIPFPNTALAMYLLIGFP